MRVLHFIVLLCRIYVIGQWPALINKYLAGEGEQSCARQTVFEWEGAGHDFPPSPGNYSCRHAISSVRAGPRCTASKSGVSTTLQLIFVHVRISTLLLDD